MRDRVIAGRYQVEERLGAGGMGVVWRARDIDLGRTVALKQSHQGDGGQIRREARIGAGLHHPNVVTVFDVVEDEGERWLVMEFLPSRSLASIAEEGPVPPALAARIGMQLAGALAAMHAKGMVHRDVKPGNVLVTDDGVAKLSDLGIARWAEVTVTGGSDFGGTPGYLAPEVAGGHEAVAAGDVFALGATLFAVVTGRSPWGAGDPAVQQRRAVAYELEPVTGELAPVLTELMSELPAERPSAQRAAEMLGELIGEAPPTVPLPSRRTKRVLGAVAGVVLLAAGTVTYVVLSQPDYIGDPATMDPCGLFVTSAVSQYTDRPVTVVRDGKSFFNECTLRVPLSAAEKDVVEVKLKVQQPNLFGELPEPPGEIQEQRYPIDENTECTTDLALPDGNSIRIISSHQEKKPAAQICGIRSDLVHEAVEILRRDRRIPRLDHAVPAQSLARVDACGLLRATELRDALGTQVPPYPELGGWGCSWDTGEREITVEYYREPPLVPADHGRRTDVEGRELYVKRPSPDNWPDACSARIVHRRYQDSPAMVESLRIYIQQKVDDPETLCGVAEDLGRAAVGRLPSP